MHKLYQNGAEIKRDASRYRALQAAALGINVIDRDIRARPPLAELNPPALFGSYNIVWKFRVHVPRPDGVWIPPKPAVRDNFHGSASRIHHLVRDDSTGHELRA